MRDRERAWEQAQAARAAATERIGIELMAAYNQDKTDPALMAAHGHSTTFGYEFDIERDGVVHVVKVERDLDS